MSKKELSRETAADQVIDELPLPYIETDIRGVVTRANRATLELHPAERGVLVGRSAWEFMASDEMDPSFAAYVSSMESGEDPPVVLRSLYDRTKTFRTYEMHRSMIHDEEGKPAGMRMLCLDVTERKRAQEEAERKLRWLESLFDSSAEPMIATDVLGSICNVNPAAERLLGATAAELEGRPIEEALRILDFTSQEGAPLTDFMALCGPVQGTATLLDHEGCKLRVEMSVAPVMEKGSDLTTGLITVLRKLR